MIFLITRALREVIMPSISIDIDIDNQCTISIYVNQVLYYVFHIYLQLYLFFKKKIYKNRSIFCRMDMVIRIM